MDKSWVRIKDLNFYSIKVRGKTEWKFMEFISDDNISGITLSWIRVGILNSRVAIDFIKSSCNPYLLNEVIRLF